MHLVCLLPFMYDVLSWLMVDKVQERWSEPLLSSFLFHMAPYSASLLLALGGDFTAVSLLTTHCISHCVVICSYVFVLSFVKKQ